jgi:hypothetical protein
MTKWGPLKCQNRQKKRKYQLKKRKKRRSKLPKSPKFQHSFDFHLIVYPFTPFLENSFN